VLIEGFKSALHSRIEVYRREVGKPAFPSGKPATWPASCSDTPFPDAGRPGWSASTTWEAVVELILAKAESLDAVLARGAGRGRLMAQLNRRLPLRSPGPLLPVVEMERLIAGRVPRRSWKWRTSGLATRSDASSRRTWWRADDSAAVRQFRGGRLCGTPRRPRRRPRDQARDRRTGDGRPRGGEGARARRGDPHLHRRPDAGRRRHGVSCRRIAGSKENAVMVPPGLETRRQQAGFAGEDLRKGRRHACRPAGG